MVAAWLDDTGRGVAMSAAPPSGSPWTMNMEATTLESFSTCSKLKVRQVTAIKLNYIVVVVAILLAQSNLGAD